MRFAICVACGAKEDLQHHHLVTKTEGGTDHPTNLITLCFFCHLKLNGRQKNGAYSASQQVKRALQLRKAQGVKLSGLNARGIQTRNEAKARALALKPVLKELAGKPPMPSRANSTTARYRPRAAGPGTPRP